MAGLGWVSEKRQMTENEMNGGQVDHITQPPPTNITPGPTWNLRGIERNTNRGVNDGPPKIEGVTEITYTKGWTPEVHPFRVWENE